MSVMGFKKKCLYGVGGWCELYPSLFWIFGIFLTLQSSLVISVCHAAQGNILMYTLWRPGPDAA